MEREGDNMEIVSSQREIEECQQQFERVLKSNSSKSGKATIGYQGESFQMEVYYFEDIDFWCSFQELDTRFWNAFGLGNPHGVSNNSIVVR